AAMRVEDFLARVEELHRTAGLHRQLRDHELEVERLALSPERAPERRLDDADLGLLELEDAGELAVKIVRHLRRRPKGQMTVLSGYRRSKFAFQTSARFRSLRASLAGLPVADRAVGLDRRVRRTFEEVLAVDHEIRGSEVFVDRTEREI